MDLEQTAIMRLRTASQLSGVLPSAPDYHDLQRQGQLRMRFPGGAGGHPVRGPAQSYDRGCAGDGPLRPVGVPASGIEGRGLHSQLSDL